MTILGSGNIELLGSGNETAARRNTMMAVLFRNAVESLSACRLRITAVLRLGVYRGSSTATYSATNTHDLNCRQPNTPPFPQSRSCTRRLCCGSGLYSAYCRSCLTFSVLRRIRRCMHTSVGKLNGQTLMDVSSQRFVSRIWLLVSSAATRHGEYEWQDPKSPDEV